MGPLRNIPFNLADRRVFGATYTGLAAAQVGTLAHARGGRNLATTDGLFPRVLAAAVEVRRVAEVDGVQIVLAALDVVWKVLAATYGLVRVLAAIDEVRFAFFGQRVNGDKVSHKVSHKKYYDKY